MIFDKRILGPCKVAAKEKDGATILKNLYINGKTVTSTNGYLCIQTQLPDDQSVKHLFDVSDLQHDIVLIPAEHVAKSCKKISKVKNVTVLKYIVVKREDQHRLCIENTRVGCTESFIFNEPEGEFPNTERVMSPAKEGKKSVCVSINPKFMIQIMEAFIASGCGSSVKMSFREQNDPIFIEAKDSDKKPIEGLLMPIRSEL